MSDISTPTGAHTVGGVDTSYGQHDVERRSNDHVDTSQESKSGFKTTEFIVWLVASALVLIASLVVDRGDGNGEGTYSAFRGFQLFTWITVAYIISRGLAKIGVRHNDR